MLQRARLADPLGGVWEAADVQWWWGKPQRSDEIEQIFWLDDDGPVAGVLLTSSADDSGHASAGFDGPISDDDVIFVELARRSGLTPQFRDNTGWMEACDRPAISTPADGFVLLDHTQRLEQCSLYDPALDLVVESTEGRVAGYSLYWFDPMTRVGLVEPVRVEDEFQRRDLASVMLSAGIDRLVARGAGRVKISYGSEAAVGTYQRIGFGATSTATWCRHSAD